MADNVTFMNQVCRGKAVAFEVFLILQNTKLAIQERTRQSGIKKGRTGGGKYVDFNSIISDYIHWLTTNIIRKVKILNMKEGVWKHDLREEIRSLQKAYKVASTNVSKTQNSYFCEKCEEFGLEPENEENEMTFKRKEDEVVNENQTEGNFYKKKIENLRAALNDIKNKIGGNAKPRKVHKRAKTRYQRNEWIPKNKPKMQTATFNTNVVFERKSVKEEKPVEFAREEALRKSSVQPELVEVSGIKSIEADTNNKSLNISELEINPKAIPASAKKSHYTSIHSKKQNSSLNKSPEPCMKNSCKGSEKLRWCEEEVLKLNSLKQSIAEIKSHLHEYSKSKISLFAFDEAPVQVIKSKPSKKNKQNVHPKHSSQTEKTQNESIQAFKKYYRKKSLAAKNVKRQRPCKKCLGLLHRGLSSKDCPIHCKI